MAGGVIIRIQAAIDAAATDTKLTIEQKAAMVRALAHQYTQTAHNWFGRKFIELKAVFGFH